MSGGLYILDGKKPVKAASALEWSEWFEAHFEDRVVRVTQLSEGVRVSTVFIGIDHDFFGEGRPLLFETMVFGGACDGECERDSTWEEAEETHKRLVGR